jgi:hypothetical protein
MHALKLASNGNPAKSADIQAKCIGTALALEEIAGFLNGNFRDHADDTAPVSRGETAALLRNIAAALNPYAEQAEKAQDLKQASAGRAFDTRHVSDGGMKASPPTPIEELNAANKAFWAKHQGGKQ